MHVGATGHIEDEDAQSLLAAAWPEAQGAPPRSCIIGRARLGRRVGRDGLQSPWTFAVSGPECRIIEEAIEFDAPALTGPFWYVQEK